MALIIFMPFNFSDLSVECVQIRGELTCIHTVSGGFKKNQTPRGSSICTLSLAYQPVRAAGLLFFTTDRASSIRPGLRIFWGFICIRLDQTTLYQTEPDGLFNGNQI